MEISIKPSLIPRGLGFFLVCLGGKLIRFRNYGHLPISMIPRSDLYHVISRCRTLAIAEQVAFFLTWPETDRDHLGMGEFVQTQCNTDRQTHYTYLTNIVINIVECVYGVAYGVTYGYV